MIKTIMIMLTVIAINTSLMTIASLKVIGTSIERLLNE